MRWIIFFKMADEDSRSVKKDLFGVATKADTPDKMKSSKRGQVTLKTPAQDSNV